jgi:hypothetical protein
MAALLAVLFLWPAGPERKPALADSPPLQPVTRTSVVIAPAAIALSAIRDAMEAQAPRDLPASAKIPLGNCCRTPSSDGRSRAARLRSPAARKE